MKSVVDNILNSDSIRGIVNEGGEQMKNLEAHIEDRNRWNALFKKEPMTFPLTQEDVIDLAQGIDCDLSPENLHCDGEISHQAAQAKYNVLTATLRELKQYAKDSGLTIPDMYSI
jgi:hypothetical protein